MSTKIFDINGKLLEEIPGTQPHPMGTGARDAFGRPLDGPFAGTWEPGSPDAPTAPGSRIGAIVEAIRKVDLGVTDNVTAKGKPRVEAIEAAGGLAITWHERDLAWSWMQTPRETTTTDGEAPTTRRPRR